MHGKLDSTVHFKIDRLNVALDHQNVNSVNVGHSLTGMQTKFWSENL